MDGVQKFAVLVEEAEPSLIATNPCEQVPSNESEEGGWTTDEEDEGQIDSDDKIEQEEAVETTSDGPLTQIGWMASLVESFVESTEGTLSAAASTLREGVSETMQTVSTNLFESEFYKNNLTYVPPEDHSSSAPAANTAASSSTAHAVASEGPSSSQGITSTKAAVHPTVDKSRKPNGDRTSGFFSLEESLLSQVDSAPIEDRIAAAQQSIGFLKINISQARRLFVDVSNRSPGTTHPYLQVRLGSHQHWTSPVAKEDPRKPGVFAFNRDITMVAQDVHTDLIIEVRQKNVLVSDSLIGQILVPLTSIIPCVREALSGQHHRCEPYRLSSWFELFPLREGRRKFKPGSYDIAGTGMWKVEPTLGYVHIDIELHLHGRISMWAGYGMPASEDLMDIPKLPVPTGDLKAMSAVVETGRGFKRNFQRVRVAFSRLFSRGKYAWAPLRFVRKARTFEDWRISLFVLFAATYICLLAPPSLLPINLYIVALVSTVSGWQGWREPAVQQTAPQSPQKPQEPEAPEEQKYIVWNQDIRDPDDLLGSIQKLAKVIYLLEKFERWMGLAADMMERIIHVFSFADERVTIAAMLSLGVLTFGLSFALLFFTWGYLFYFAFLFWFFKPTLTSFGLFKKKEKSPRQLRRAQMLHHSDEDLRANGRAAQAIAVARLIAQAPSLARNVFARVPTEDELGHRWISSLQRVNGEPPEFSDDEDDDGPGPHRGSPGQSSAVGGSDGGDGDVPADEIWLREL